MKDDINIKYYAECKVINPTDKEYEEIIKQILTKENKGDVENAELHIDTKREF